MRTKIVLIIILCVTLFLHIYKINEVPACLNADEAAFGYNAYSILKTGKDEYGKSFPFRLKSFGDYKLPLYSFLTIPSVSTFGLNETAVRFPAILAGILFPLAIFVLTKKLLHEENVALLAGFLTAMSPWFTISSRTAHEGVLLVILLAISIVFLLKALESLTLKNVFFFSLFLFFSLFSYHIARIFAVFLIGYFILFLWRKKENMIKAVPFLVILFIPLFIAFFIDIRQSPDRLKNLIFYNTAGFNLKINELRGEHNIRLLHNKLTQSTTQLSQEYLKYFSPQFLVTGETSNLRFGHPGISPLTIVEYIFFFCGLYYLFKNQEKYRYFLLGLLLISPLPASLTWQEYSVNRSFFILVPGLIIASYGFIEVLKESKGIHRNVILVASLLLFAFFNILSLDFYFFHYMKRPQVIRSLECGNREMALFIKENYDRYDTFYITRKNGQPYISVLFYLQYPPERYQKEASLSNPDEYGFGQIEKFDKFEFNFKFNPRARRAVFIGYPDDFNNTGITYSDVKKIRIGNEEIFWIYES